MVPETAGRTSLEKKGKRLNQAWPWKTGTRCRGADRTDEKDFMNPSNRENEFSWKQGGKPAHSARIGKKKIAIPVCVHLRQRNLCSKNSNRPTGSETTISTTTPEGKRRASTNGRPHQYGGRKGGISEKKMKNGNRLPYAKKKEEEGRKLLSKAETWWP